MNTWKLTIKPASKPGYYPLKLCREHSLVGVGWSYVFEDPGIRSKETAYAKLTSDYNGKVPRAIVRLLDEVQSEEFIWIHKEGEYYLCKVRGESSVLGPEIDGSYRKCDIGFCRHAEWVKVTPLLVPGHVQRGLIAPVTIRRIPRCGVLAKYFCHIHLKLSEDPDWAPQLNESRVSYLLSKNRDSLRHILTPDDYEDIVAAYLQSEGWTIIKSSCYRTRPKFEFVVVRKRFQENEEIGVSEYGHVQVKSGRVSLDPAVYRKWVHGNEIVILYASDYIASDSKFDGITLLSEEKLLKWAAANPWVLSLGAKLLLQLSCPDE